MSLSQTLKYSDIVNYVVDEVKSVCQNVDSNYNSLEEFVKAGWQGSNVEIARGSQYGQGSRLYNSCYVNVTLVSGGVSQINSESNDPEEVTVKSMAEAYLKKVNNNLNATVTNAKLQAVYQAIISFCNDNIKIICAECPFLNSENIGKFSYCNKPIFVPSQVPTASFDSSIRITANEMIDSIDDFSTVVRKNTHPKIHAVTYNLVSYNRDP